MRQSACDTASLPHFINSCYIRFLHVDEINVEVILITLRRFLSLSYVFRIIREIVLYFFIFVIILIVIFIIVLVIIFIIGVVILFFILIIVLRIFIVVLFRFALRY